MQDKINALPLTLQIIDSIDNSQTQKHKLHRDLLQGYFQFMKNTDQAQFMPQKSDSILPVEFEDLVQQESN